MPQPLHSRAASNWVRLAAASPRLSLSDVQENTKAVIDCILKADKLFADFLVLPELCLTGATLGTLLNQPIVLAAALSALKEICDAVKNTRVMAAVGLPYSINGKVLSAVALLRGARVYAILPASCPLTPFGFLPETDSIDNCEIALAPVPKLAVCFGGELFARSKVQAGYTVLMPSSLNATAGSYGEIKRRLASFSARTGTAVAYASPNPGESATSFAFDGLCAVAAGGEVLQIEAPFGEETFVYADVDTAALFPFEPFVEQRPKGQTYLSSDAAEREEELERILSLQETALMRRAKHIGSAGFVVGVSGGLDSALALVAAAGAAKKMGYPKESVLGVSMPGFGSSSRTKNNAKELALSLGCSYREIDIRPACERHFEDIGYQRSGEGRDTVFENAQARERTKILLSISNMENLLDVGTGDLSELALGWTTFGGDHLAQYGVNASLPKTIVRLAAEQAKKRFPEAAAVLDDILKTPVSPELWALKDGEQEQKTEELIGSYELHDFFLYHMLTEQKSPRELYTLAVNALPFSQKEIHRVLGIFLKRFFSQQFKRNCATEAPHILLSIAPSVLTMPSDMRGAEWMREYESIEP